MGQRHAKRLPKGLKPIRPGELVQIDTLFVNVAPDKAVTPRSPTASGSRFSSPRILRYGLRAGHQSLLRADEVID